MRKRKTFHRLCLTAMLVFAAALAAPGKASAAVTLNFSDISSDETLASALRAQVTFVVTGSQLHISIDNQSAYKIAQLYFNTDATLTSLGFAGAVNPAWSVQGTGASQNHMGDGMGRHNFLVDFGSGANRLDAGVTVLTFNMTGTTSESTIRTRWSSNNRAISVLKFEAGPGDDSAFGGTRGGINPVPEPSTVLLAVSGLATLGFSGLRRLRRRSPST